jgi:hypothetical protein
VSEVVLQFHVSAGLDAPVFEDLARLGVLKVSRHWDGRAAFNFPAPFEQLQIVDRETLDAEKREHLRRAFQYFRAIYGE